MPPNSSILDARYRLLYGMSRDEFIALRRRHEEERRLSRHTGGESMFKVGDKVRYVYKGVESVLGGSPPYNTEGKIVRITEMDNPTGTIARRYGKYKIGVEFKDWDYGHAICGAILTHASSGWWCVAEELVLIEEKPPEYIMVWTENEKEITGKLIKNPQLKIKQ